MLRQQQHQQKLQKLLVNQNDYGDTAKQEEKTTHQECMLLYDCLNQWLLSLQRAHRTCFRLELHPDLFQVEQETQRKGTLVPQWNGGLFLIKILILNEILY